MPSSPLYSDEELLAELRRVADKVSGPVRTSDFVAASSISPHTVLRRFGSWRAALTAAGLGDRTAGAGSPPK